MIVTTSLSGSAVLRLHLLHLFMDGTDTPDLALDQAKAAHDWIVSDFKHADPMPCGQDLPEGPVTAAPDTFDPVGKGKAEREYYSNKAKPEKGELMKDRLEALFAQGLETHEIAELTGLARNSVSARASSYGLTGMWRAARTARRATQTEPTPILDDLEVRKNQPATSQQRLPVPSNTDKPKISAAPEQSKRFGWTSGASNLPPQTQREKADERAKIDAELTAKNIPITRVHSPGKHPGGKVTIEVVIDYLRWAGDSIVNMGKNLWMFNDGKPLNATELVEKANKYRKREKIPAFVLVRG